MEDKFTLNTVDSCCDNIATCETPVLLKHQCGETSVTCCVEDNEHKKFVELATVLQDSVLHSWKLHLKTKKYYIHVILEEYYDEALDIIDGLIEHYQGICK